MSQTPDRADTPMPRAGKGNRSPRFRNWCFTLNNWVPSDEQELTALGNNKALCKYIIWGREVGESGTPHLQGFVAFANQQTLSRCKDLLSTRVKLHVEPANDVDGSIKYCMKDGSFVEIGTRPNAQKARAANAANETKKAKAALFLEAIKDGATTLELAASQPSMFLNHYRGLEQLRDMLRGTVSLSFSPKRCIWIWGSSGIGKSRMARDLYPHDTTYLKMPDNKWWDGFCAHKCVILDDVDPNMSPFLTYQLKIWADGYPFTAEMKGGTKQQIWFETLIVTSQYDIAGIFGSPETLEAIVRRFDTVINLTESYNGAGVPLGCDEILTTSSSSSDIPVPVDDQEEPPAAPSKKRKRIGEEGNKKRRRSEKDADSDDEDNDVWRYFHCDEAEESDQ